MTVRIDMRQCVTVRPSPPAVWLYCGRINGRFSERAYRGCLLPRFCMQQPQAVTQERDGSPDSARISASVLRSEDLLGRKDEKATEFARVKPEMLHC